MLLQSFSRYLNYKKDNNELLMFILRQLVSDYNRFQRNRYGDVQEYAQVQEKELSEKVPRFTRYFFGLCFLTNLDGKKFGKSLNVWFSFHLPENC